jgi:hypothetical protein
VPSVYDAFVNTDGSEIEQDFKLRLIPVAFTVRVLPMGQSSGVQPYFGGGIGIATARPAISSTRGAPFSMTRSSPPAARPGLWRSRGCGLQATR